MFKVIYRGWGGRVKFFLEVFRRKNMILIWNFFKNEFLLRIFCGEEYFKVGDI